MTRFWMVWRESGYAPTRKHLSEAEAKAEAERLATEHRGSVFYVLEMTGAVKVVAPFVWKRPVDVGEHPHQCQCDDCTIPF